MAVFRESILVFKILIVVMFIQKKDCVEILLHMILIGEIKDKRRIIDIIYFYDILKNYGSSPKKLVEKITYNGWLEKKFSIHPYSGIC